MFFGWTRTKSTPVGAPNWELNRTNFRLATARMISAQSSLEIHHIQFKIWCFSFENQILDGLQQRWIWLEFTQKYFLCRVLQYCSNADDSLDPLNPTKLPIQIGKIRFFEPSNAILEFCRHYNQLVATHPSSLKKPCRGFYVSQNILPTSFEIDQIQNIIDIGNWLFKFKQAE
jgi:hypothetical protein